MTFNVALTDYAVNNANTMLTHLANICTNTHIAMRNTETDTHKTREHIKQDESCFSGSFLSLQMTLILFGKYTNRQKHIEHFDR